MGKGVGIVVFNLEDRHVFDRKGVMSVHQEKRFIRLNAAFCRPHFAAENIGNRPIFKVI